VLFAFPEDARWNAETQAVEFGVGIGEYEGVVRGRRIVFQRLVDGAVTPGRCVETTTCTARGWSASPKRSCARAS
jgi:hypothetical protein